MSEDRFTLTAEHVALARRMNVSYRDAEYGAPCIDPKRPYGNGDVPGDIADILGWEKRFDARTGEPLQEVYDRAAAIHKEMETALSVILRAGSFEPGEYVADKYGSNWRPHPGGTGR